MVVVQYEENKEFGVGDRVIVRDLKNATHLNSMHGTVASLLLEGGRHTVDLDLMFPNADGTSNKKNKRLSIKTCNLKREPPLSSARPRAKVENGALVEQEGRALSFVLDSMQLCLAGNSQFRESIRDFEDLERLRQSEHGLKLLNLLTTTAWTFWNSIEDIFLPKGWQDSRGIYGLLHDFVRINIAGQDGGVEGMIKNEGEAGKIFYYSVGDIEAVKGWNVRVHGVFWIVGMDNEGTYLVPDQNQEVVYQCLGIKNPIWQKVAYYGGPSKAHVTLIPWYGRLVHDNVLTYINNSVADPALTKKLKKTIEKARREGRIIQRFAQLEVEGGSLLGVQDIVKKSAIAPALDDPPSAEEKELMRQLFSIPSMGGEILHEGGKEKVWIFRRMGYSEEKNPAHIGSLAYDTGEVAGMFKCSALIPTPAEIFASLVQHAEKLGVRPIGVGVDDEGCSKRLAVLSREEDIMFYHYLPPCEEEAVAISAARGR